MNRILGERYEILEKIGEGGMAYVYKAKCRLLNRYVAIKILRPEFLQDKKFIENFRRESQASAGMNHPNIVNIYDVGIENDDIYYIVMEYVEGETLNKIIEREGRLNDYQTVMISRQIASALSCAHKKNIIHRDVKPHNIIVTYDGVAKITDFGIARAVTNATLVASESIMGSVHYFSPEQAKGGYIDGRSDLYSLGIMMYEMVTGRVPFDGDNPVTIAMKHIKNEIVPPSKYNPEISQALERIIMIATQKHLVNRFSDADEMIVAMNTFFPQNPQFPGSVYDDYMSNDNSQDDDKYKNDYSEDVYDNNTIVMDKSVIEDDYYDEAEDEYIEDDEKIENLEEKPSEIYRAEVYNSEPDPIPKTKRQLKADKKAAKKATKIEKKKHKRKKITVPRVLGIIFGIVLAVLASSGLLALRDFIFLPDVVVPDVIGMDYSEAKKTFDKSGLGIEIEEKIFSNIYKENEVCNQDPYQGEKVKKGFVVHVTISKGSEDGVLKEGVPNVLGKSLDSATEILENAGYQVGIVSREESREKEGTVLSQDPGAGEEGEENGIVNLIISKGGDNSSSSEVTMINLIGADIDMAKEMLESANLSINNIQYKYSDKYDSGEVMEQSIPFGEKVAARTKVNLTVSRGEGKSNYSDNTSKISSIPLILDYNNAQNDVFEIKINMVKGNNVTLVHDAVHYKSNNGESISVSGSGKATLMIYFDNKLVGEGTADFDAGTFSN